MTGLRAYEGAWIRYLTEQAARQELVPWAEWLDEAWNRLPVGTRYPSTTTALWKRLRSHVLKQLELADLRAEIVRTDGVSSVAEHFADLAGLVRLRAGGPTRGHAPDDPHLQRLGAAHSLVPAAAPRSLRGFCGQLADEDSHLAPTVLLDVFDHVRTWTDAAGTPVLSLEPYNFAHDPGRLVARLNRIVAVHRLPLVVDGPYRGEWSTTTVLVLLRYDAAAEPLPATSSSSYARELLGDELARVLEMST